jgi:DnaJ family protein A protein 2
MFRPKGNTDNSLYIELEVDRNATTEMIKKSHRRLALIHHPDKGGIPEKFQKIQAAYEILSDPTKKENYDKYGMEGISNESMEFNGSSVFDMFFKQNGHQQHSKKRKGNDVKFNVNVTLKDLYVGKLLKMAINRKVMVGLPITCNGCRGTGHIIQIHQFAPGMIQQIQRPCGNCQGKGSSCEMKQERKIVELNIQPGTQNTHVFQVSAAGDEAANTEPGDVIIQLVTEKHATFARSGNDLFIKKTISLLEALIGFTINVTHLDGRNIQITSNKSLDMPKTGKSILRCVKGEGMPLLHKQNVKGDLYIAFDIEFPANIVYNKSESEALRAILPPCLHVLDKHEGITHEIHEVPEEIIKKINSPMETQQNEHNGTQCAQS